MLDNWSTINHAASKWELWASGSGLLPPSGPAVSTEQRPVLVQVSHIAHQTPVTFQKPLSQQRVPRV